MEKPSYTAITVERRRAADWVTLSRPDRVNALATGSARRR
jgi:enoyl-CoA hydratase/carnithine racemase